MRCASVIGIGPNLLACRTGVLWSRRVPVTTAERSPCAARGAAFTACPIVAALDTLQDTKVPGPEALADTRRVWGSRDVQNPGTPRMTRGSR